MDYETSADFHVFLFEALQLSVHVDCIYVVL